MTITHIQKRQAATLGKQAAEEGFDTDFCPYGEGDPLRQSWLLGFQNEIARRDAEAARIGALPPEDRG